MQLKKIWAYIGFLLILFPVAAYSQTGLHELQQGRMGVGLDFSRGQNFIGIGGSLDYGMSSRTKIALVANTGILDSVV